MNSLYPPKPEVVNPLALAPSAAFKKQVGVVVTNIVLFFVVYLLLMAAAVVLAIGCVYGGIMLIVAMPKFITLIAGLGLIAVGGSVVFFLIKFIFAVQKNVNEARVEITEESQPRLFEFIKRLTQETQTPFPKKIYLSPDVNACVFYHSSFWSMFLPVRKNLEIGVGLVNALNMGEFKAVMAHEFGHFSQRSMKLGSFTYNVNRIIYNMLYDNSGYTGFLNTWGNLHGLLSIFAVITAKIAEAIQWVLKGMYGLINKAYMGLSREMEFHADTIAASVAGGNNIIAALNRIAVANLCFQEAMAKANESLPRKQATANLFADQSVVMRFRENEQDGNSPNNASRINYKDQWASHPTIEERTAYVQQLNMEAPVSAASAWEIFDNPHELQTNMTRKVYEVAQVETELTLYNEEQFEQQYRNDKEAWALPPQYMDWFKGRYPEKEVLDHIENEPALPSTLEQLMNESDKNLPAQLLANEQDAELVTAIEEKRIDVASFDFDGQKYTASEAAKVIAILRKEIEAQQQQLKTADTEVLRYAWQKNSTGFPAFKEAVIRQEQFIAVAKEVLAIILPFYNANNFTLEHINAEINKLKNTAEPLLKDQWKQMLEKNVLSENEELRQLIITFNQKYYSYWYDSQFQSAELNELYDLITRTDQELSRIKFRTFRSWLEQTL